MPRRRFLNLGATAVVLGGAGAARSGAVSPRPSTRRVRPGDPGWPGPQAWAQLAEQTHHRLLPVRSPLDDCRSAAAGADCATVLAELNPFFIGESAGLTQTLGWMGAWTSRPSAYAVAAEEISDVVAAVDFARKHDLRLVVKGGGHSYQGTSNAPDSLLVWTRRMDAIVLHEAFVGEGCAGAQAPQPAATIGAGALWGEAYERITTQGGRYVQGGGCMTVGVAGLIQSGGFGSFSKRYGLAAAGLIEAQIVTADGAVRTVNACTHPDLFWALKGGGGGSFGVVTSLTLRTHELPDILGGVTATISARSDGAYRRLVERLIAFYAQALFNPHWGEQLFFIPGNAVWVRMTFAGLSLPQARAAWRPFFAWVLQNAADYEMAAPVFHALPGRHFWDPQALKAVPGIVVSDSRPGAPKSNVVWAGDAAEAGQYLEDFESLWLDRDLLDPSQQPRLCAALFDATRRWWVSLQFNKGLAGAPPEALAGARQTAINPVVLDAFALAISSSAQHGVYPGIAGHEPDRAQARTHAASVRAAMNELRALPGAGGAYVSESDFFQRDWAGAFWGPHYKRLAAIKAAFDPGGLFFVHHGVGSEDWSADGFERLR